MSKLFTVTSVGTAVGLQVVLIRELLTTMRCDSRVAVELWRSIKYFWRSKQTRAQSRDFTLTPRSAHFRAHAQSTRLVDTSLVDLPQHQMAVVGSVPGPKKRIGWVLPAIHLSLYLYIYACMSPFLYFSISPYLPLSVSLYIYIHLSVSPSAYFSKSLSLYIYIFLYFL